MTRHRVLGAGALPCGELRRVEVEGRPICLARLDDGAIYAIGDTCTHEGASLSEGELYKGSVQCPLHGSLFSVQDGSVTGMPAQLPVATYPVSIDGDDVIVDV